MSLKYVLSLPILRSCRAKPPPIKYEEADVWSHILTGRTNRLQGELVACAIIDAEGRITLQMGT